MSKWIDVTTHLASDKKRESTTFQLKIGGLTLGLARHISHEGKWIAHLHPLFNMQILEAESLEDTQKEAVDLAKQHVTQVVMDLGSVE